MILDSGVIPTEEQLVEILDIDEIDSTLKHLPGRHDQESHTPRLYIGGKPVTTAFFADGGSRLIKDLSPDLKRTVVDALIHYGVTEEELTDLEGFTSRPAEGYIYDKLNSYFTDPDDPERQVLGLYDTRTRIVSVAPMMAYREDGEKVVLHEVGHHVAAENPKYANRRAAAGFVMSQLTHKGVGPIEAIDYGLREYSFTNEKEFLADTYLCLKAGNEVQKRNLNAAYEEIGYEEGMAGVLKELLALKHLPGRHDQKSHGRGKRDNPYATGAVVVDSYSKLAPVAGNNPHAGKGYFILADGNLLDMKSESHLQAYVDYDAAKHLGISPEETEHAIGVYDMWTSNEGMEELSRLHTKAMAAGNVRVREYGKTSVNIETHDVDNTALRKLQRLYDAGKLGLAPKEAIYWSSSNGIDNIHIADMNDFLDAKSVADLKRRTQFKHLPGRHDQKSHAPHKADNGFSIISHLSNSDVARLDSYAGLKYFRGTSNGNWISCLYDFSRRKFYMTDDSDGHIAIARALYPDDGAARNSLMDNSVRFAVSDMYRRDGLYLTFDAAYAGAGSDYDRGMRNIYKVFDALVSRGFPANTKVELSSREAKASAKASV